MSDTPPLRSAGTALMSYYWLDNQYYDAPALDATDPDWRDKVDQRDVQRGNAVGFVIGLSGSLDSPSLRAFCETHGIAD